jgi:hypothetical protein
MMNYSIKEKKKNGDAKNMAGHGHGAMTKSLRVCVRRALRVAVLRVLESHRHMSHHGHGLTVSSKGTSPLVLVALVQLVCTRRASMNEAHGRHCQKAPRLDVEAACVKKEERRERTLKFCLSVQIST